MIDLTNKPLFSDDQNELQYNGQFYVAKPETGVVGSNGCDECAMNDADCKITECSFCTSSSRKDRRDIIWVKAEFEVKLTAQVDHAPTAPVENKATFEYVVGELLKRGLVQSVMTMSSPLSGKNSTFNISNSMHSAYFEQIVKDLGLEDRKKELLNKLTAEERQVLGYGNYKEGE